MNNKNAMKKSLVFLCACTIFVLISATPNFGNAATAEDPVTAYFAPELTPGSNFTWKVNEFWGMSEWLIPSPYYDPQAGDLWELKIVKDLPSLSLDGSISANISEWYEVDFDATLDIKDYFEFNISGNDYYDAFGDESNPALNWRMLHQLFLLPFTVENGVKQNFADFYGAAFDEDADVDTTDGGLILRGTLSDGVYQNNSIELNCSLGLREEFVYNKKQYDTGISIGMVNLTLIESEFGSPPPSIPVYYYIIGGGGVLLLGVATVLLVRRAKVRKPTSQTAPGPHDLGSKTKPDPDPGTEPDPEPEDPEPESEPEPEDPEPEPEDPEPESEPEPEDPEDPEPEPEDPEPEPDPANNPNPQPSDPDPDPNDDGSGGIIGGGGFGGTDSGTPTPEPDPNESPLDDDDDKFIFR